MTRQMLYWVDIISIPFVYHINRYRFPCQFNLRKLAKPESDQFRVSEQSKINQTCEDYTIKSTYLNQTWLRSIFEKLFLLDSVICH